MFHRESAYAKLPEFFGGEIKTLHDIQPLVNPAMEIKRSLPALRAELDRLADLAETAQQTSEREKYRLDEGVPVANLIDAMKEFKSGVEDSIIDVLDELARNMEWED